MADSLEMRLEEAAVKWTYSGLPSTFKGIFHGEPIRKVSIVYLRTKLIIGAAKIGQTGIIWWSSSPHVQYDLPRAHLSAIVEAKHVEINGETTRNITSSISLLVRQAPPNRFFKSLLR